MVSDAEVPERADVLITRRILADEVTSALESRFHVTYGRPGAKMPREELLKRVSDVRALISFHSDRIDEELLARAQELRIVATLAVGFDNIDLAAATRRGVWVANTPSVVTEPTADLTLLLLLATLRRAGEGYELVRHGNWTEVSPDALWGEDPSGLSLGVLGFGRIGKALARRVGPLGMHVIYHDPARLPPEMEESIGVQWVEFDELLATCDVLSVHLPLLPETRGRIGRSELARMKRGSYVINAARGPIIDEDALIEALRSGHIAGVGLDVYTREPHIPAALRKHPRAFCLPHIATATRRTRLAMMKMCVDNVLAVLDGAKPLTPLNDIASGKDGHELGSPSGDPAGRLDVRETGAGANEREQVP